MSRITPQEAAPLSASLTQGACVSTGEARGPVHANAGRASGPARRAITASLQFSSSALIAGGLRSAESGLRGAWARLREVRRSTARVTYADLHCAGCDHWLHRAGECAWTEGAGSWAVPCDCAVGE